MRPARRVPARLARALERGALVLASALYRECAGDRRLGGGEAQRRTDAAIGRALAERAWPSWWPRFRRSLEPWALAVAPAARRPRGQHRYLGHLILPIRAPGDRRRGLRWYVAAEPPSGPPPPEADCQAFRSRSEAKAAILLALRRAAARPRRRRAR